MGDLKIENLAKSKQILKVEQETRNFIELFDDYTKDVKQLSDAELDRIQSVVPTNIHQELKKGVSRTRLRLILLESGEATFLKLASLLDESTILYLLNKKKDQNSCVNLPDQQRIDNNFNNISNTSAFVYYN